MVLMGVERSGIMISAEDKKIYFPISFNEQMAWLGEEIERTIKNNDKSNIHTINRLFEIIKEDPKNKALLQEICKAEQGLMAYLYDEPGAWSEEQIYAYWNSYLQSYIAELVVKTHVRIASFCGVNVYCDLAFAEGAYIDLEYVGGGEEDYCWIRMNIEDGSFYTSYKYLQSTLKCWYEENKSYLMGIYQTRKIVDIPKWED